MSAVIRQATVEDLPHCPAIMVDALNDLMVRVGKPPTFSLERSSHPVWWNHLFNTSAGFWIAEQHDVPVGFANCVRREGEWFLTHLFVRPDVQSAGLGKQLMAACWQSAGDAQVRAVVADTANLVSVSLYARYDMGPQVPLFNLQRSLDHDLWQRDVPQVELEAVETLSADADKDWLGQFDRTIRGHARPADHAYWQSAGLTLYRCIAGNITVGYVYTAPWGHIGPAVAGPKSLTAVVAAALHTLYQAGCAEATLVVPGQATDLLSWLLRGGFRHVALNVYCADNLRGDWRCYVPFRAGLP